LPDSALFLDRDGIINIDYGHVGSLDDFHFVPGIFDLVSLAKTAGLLVFVVTNQSGIGRGLYSEKDFFDVSDYMIKEFARRGLGIEKIYHCPHHPTEAKGGYLRDCNCRKPNPGMIFHAAKDYDLDLSRSIIIGDKETDVLAGMRAGLKTLVYIGDGVPEACTHSFQSVQLLVENWFQIYE
jgi:D-glycero-D-manno-heptose 1,7-bisphosphate phosphatase